MSVDDGSAPGERESLRSSPVLGDRSPPADGVDEVLVGVVAGRDRVAAHLVEKTPFGRLRHGGRRVVEDDDDLGLAPGVDPGGPPGATWAGCIAGAIEKLTFGLPAARLRVGVAVEGEVGVEGRRARVSGRDASGDLPHEVARVLRTRGMELVAPVTAVELPGAWAAGEAASPVGVLGDAGTALVLVWDDPPCWLLVDARSPATRARRLSPRAPRAEVRGAGGLAGASELADEARALLDGAARAATRLVISGARVHGVPGGRSQEHLRLPFRAVLPPRLLPKGPSSRGTSSSGDPGAAPDGPVWISRERHAAPIGAAAAALWGGR